MNVPTALCLGRRAGLLLYLRRTERAQLTVPQLTCGKPPASASEWWSCPLLSCQRICTCTSQQQQGCGDGTWCTSAAGAPLTTAGVCLRGVIGAEAPQIRVYIE